MNSKYHRQITRLALQPFFSSPALETVIWANLNQDKLIYQVGHPQFHFDESSFSLSTEYIQIQRQIILNTLKSNTGITTAWEAFGRLTHAGQDFYAHSNYVALWLNNLPDPAVTPDAITPLDPEILKSNLLKSGHIYHIRESLRALPWVGSLIRYFIPLDSHTWMNRDKPERGPLFVFAVEAAVKRTRLEAEFISQQILQEVDNEALSRFHGLDTKS